MRNLGFLVDRYRNGPQPRVVVRAGVRDTLVYPEMGLTLQDLNGHFEPGVLETRIATLARGARSGSTPMTHAGEEFCYVMEGLVRYHVDGKTFDLKAGDYIHFKSHLRHWWQNRHRGVSRVLLIFSSGLSF